MITEHLNLDARLAHPALTSKVGGLGSNKPTLFPQTMSADRSFVFFTGKLFASNIKRFLVITQMIQCLADIFIHSQMHDLLGEKPPHLSQASV